MKLLILFMIAITLMGCTNKDRNPILLVDKPVVYIPADKFFYCPGVIFPDPSTLTDEDVAKLLIQYESVNGLCKASLRALKNDLLKAKVTLENTQ